MKRLTVIIFFLVAGLILLAELTGTIKDYHSKPVKIERMFSDSSNAYKIQNHASVNGKEMFVISKD